MTTALLDGDIISFRAAAVLKDDDSWDAEPGKRIPLTEDEAIRTAKITVENWQYAAGCARSIICLTGAENFRYRVLSTYKSNRSDKPPPATLAAVKAALGAMPNARLVEGLEADDLMGIMLTNGRYPDAVCVTNDKDLRTVPGRHLNPIPKPGAKANPILTVTESEALVWWLTQTLIGDKVDGYSGCPGIGPVNAAKLLTGRQAVDALWPKVVAAFVSKGLTGSDALVQARVARILHASDYDRIGKRIGLWSPSGPEWIPLVP